MRIDLIVARIRNGEVYFKCASAPEYVIRVDNSVEGWIYWIKFEGETEMKTTYTSSLVTDAFLQIEFITEKEYTDFK